VQAEIDSILEMAMQLGPCNGGNHHEPFIPERKTQSETEAVLATSAHGATAEVPPWGSVGSIPDSARIRDFRRDTKSSAKTILTPTSDGLVRIPLADVNDGRARFYNYGATNGKTVRFFVIKSSDGVYRAAADACDVCYRSKMGYHQEGDDMVCNKCARRFPSNDVNVITGSCNPDGVPRSIEGSNLLIAAADLDARAAMF